MIRPGISRVEPFRFSFTLNSVETALKYPHDLIAQQVTKIQIDYGPKTSYFHISVLEDERGLVSAFFRDMLMSDRSQPAQQFQGKLTYFARTSMTATNTVIADDVWIETFRTLGLGYADEGVVENEITLAFPTDNITGEA